MLLLMFGCIQVQTNVPSHALDWVLSIKAHNNALLRKVYEVVDIDAFHSDVSHTDEGEEIIPDIREREATSFNANGDPRWSSSVAYKDLPKVIMTSDPNLK